MSQKKTVAQLLKELEELKGQVEDLKSQKTANKGKGKTEPDFKTVKQNIIKGDDGTPRAYALVQKKGKAKRIVIGAYARILKSQVRGDPKTEEEGWMPTKAEVKGKKVDAFWVPMRKGHITLSEEELEELSNGF